MLHEYDIMMLEKFCDKYPTWWYKIGVCDLTRDFDCAPQEKNPEAKYIKHGNIWDSGFSCDLQGSVSNAISHVMMDIENELKKEKGE